MANKFTKYSQIQNVRLIFLLLLSCLTLSSSIIPANGFPPRHSAEVSPLPIPDDRSLAINTPCPGKV